MNDNQSIVSLLKTRFSNSVVLYEEVAKDDTTVLWIDKENIQAVLRYLKNESLHRFKMLFDLTAIDERRRSHREGQPTSDFTIVYSLTSFDQNADIRLKVPLTGSNPTLPSVTPIWSSANWYEREVYDMFGITFHGHPDLRRILMPPWWEGHPLRKEHYARATEAGPLRYTEKEFEREEAELRFHPEKWGLSTYSEDSDYLFLNLGPQHPGTHGVLRLILQLDGEDIVDIVPDIGFHHRAAEKMAERQTWHTYLPYTDRVDYLSGLLNEQAYVLSVEKLAGIKIPPRAAMIRIMTGELFRIISHLVWLGTYAQDLGQMSPVFYAFNDRERAFDIISAVTGGRMHPNWFRIGGVAQDLPDGWDKKIQEFVDYMPKKLAEYDKMVIRNRIFKARAVGIGVYNTQEALDWGITGPGLRATGLEWDYRKKRPYDGIDQFEFDIPIGKNGDCFDRLLVRMEEMRQSLRIIQQCINNMPSGPYKSDNPLATPPIKEKTMFDIETLIHHFLDVSWGPVIPAGESMRPIEGAKGGYGYYVISDLSTNAYRCHIRTPSFPHMQMVPYISRGYTIADLLSILGSVDFVLAEIDR
jgi:NADH-quinone oxidoreductase subunit C/D